MKSSPSFAALAAGLLLATPAFAHAGLTAVPQHRGDASVVWDQMAAPAATAPTLEHPAPARAFSLAEAGNEPAGHGAAPAVTTIGDLQLSGAFTRATLPNAPVGGGYVTISNTGSEADRLVSATAAVAGDVQIHEMKMEGDVMKMGELPDGITIAPGETVTLAPGGLHLMLMQLKQPLVEGTTVPVTLTFEKAGSIDIELSVEGIAARGPAEDHSGHGG